MHISSPILYQESLNEKTDDEHQLNAPSERSPSKSPTLLPNRSNSFRTRTPHVNFTTEPPALKTSPITQPARVVSSQPATQNRSNYSIYPTSGSAMVRTSASTTMSQGSEIPTETLPPFSRAHERGFSGQSSATVQIGLRLSYLHRVLDPVEREPTSPSLHLPMQLTCSSRPSSTSSSSLFTRPMTNRVVSNAENLRLPSQPGRVQISDQARMSRSDRPSSPWPIRETFIQKPTSDNSITGVTKPLPPVPLTLRTPGPPSPAIDHSVWDQPRHF